MDPLSISVSILAIIGSVSATIKAAKSIYDAPEELESLLNDLTDAELMIHDVKFHLEEHQDSVLGSQEQLLWERLAEAQVILTKLRNIVPAPEEKTDRSRHIQRFEWMKAKKKTRKLTKQLSKIHEELPRRLGQVEGSRIKLELKNISLVQRQMSSGLSRLAEEVDDTSRDISYIHEGNEFSHQLQEQTNFSIERLRRDSLDHLQRVETVLAMNNDLLQMLPGMSELRNRSPKQVSLPTDFKQSDGGNDKESPRFETADMQDPPSYRSIMVQAQSPKVCEVTCRCRCHDQKSLRTPNFLNNLIGQIFIGYKGLPNIPKTCTEAQCEGEVSPRMLVTYFFPQWWVTDRTMLLAAKWTSNRGPELVLRFPGRHSINDNVCISIDQGNLESLKACFSSGRAYPNDVRVAGSTSWSLLHHALEAGEYGIFKFLVEIGADTNVEDSDGRAIEDIACRAVLVGKIPHNISEWISALFMSRRREHFQFSSLHTAVIGLNKLASIEEEVSKISTIDVQDVWGWTALHWASARGDLNAVKKLLELGADANITDKLERPTLEMALLSGALDCAMQLLKYNANAHHVTKKGWNTLHQAICCCEDSPQLIEFMSILVFLGVGINAQNEDGFSSLLVALQGPKNSAVRWLLGHGADCKVEIDGSTILHFLGFFGDMEISRLKTMQIFRYAYLCNIDNNAKNELGETAMDQLHDPNREIFATEEMAQYFAEILCEIEGRNNKVLPVADIARFSLNSENIQEKSVLHTQHWGIF